MAGLTLSTAVIAAGTTSVGYAQTTTSPGSVGLPTEQAPATSSLQPSTAGSQPEAPRSQDTTGSTPAAQPTTQRPRTASRAVADPASCTFYPQTGFSVCGAVRDKFNALGGPGGFLGYPTSNELTTPNGVGKFNTFQNQNGHIYWSPGSPASEIGGAIFDHWGTLGYEGGLLGFPTSDEITNPDGFGKRNTFQRNGSIYWSPVTPASQVGGAVFNKWGQYGYERGALGYPVTDEFKTPSGVGRYNFFAGFVNAIYWSPSTDAHQVGGPILQKWGEKGFETSCVGYPTSDVRLPNTGQSSTFQVGQIVYNNASGHTLYSCNTEDPYGDPYTPGDKFNEQCNQDVAQRVGNWWCPGTPIMRAQPDEPGVASRAAAGDYQGSYGAYGTTRADFLSPFQSWGKDGNKLGQAQIFAEWNLNGREIRAKPISYENSVSTYNVVFSARLTNAAAGKDGDVIQGTSGFYTAQNVPYGAKQYWTPNGFLTRDNSTFDHTQTIQISWKYAEVDGTWNSFVRSPVAHADDKLDYKFTLPLGLPNNYYAGGIRNN